MYDSDADGIDMTHGGKKPGFYEFCVKFQETYKKTGFLRFARVKLLGTVAPTAPEIYNLNAAKF
jgi:hypothetical protein